MDNFIEIIKAEDIIEINKKYSSGLMINNHLSSCYASYYFYDTFQEQISSIILSLIKNHYFQDGNKRTAFTVFIILCICNNINIPDKDYGNIFVKAANTKDLNVDILKSLLF